jgi:hypothetical protein
MQDDSKSQVPDPLIVVVAFVQLWAPLIPSYASAGYNIDRHFTEEYNLSSHTIGKLHRTRLAPSNILSGFKTNTIVAPNSSASQRAISQPPPSWEENSEELCEAGSLAKVRQMCCGVELLRFMSYCLGVGRTDWSRNFFHIYSAALF